jgi:hypothetical protein
MPRKLIADPFTAKQAPLVSEEMAKVDPALRLQASVANKLEAAAKEKK